MVFYGGFMDKYSFQLSIIERPAIPQNLATEDSLATYLAESLGLTSSRGKSLVAVKLILLFNQIANKREGVLKSPATGSNKEFEIKNGAIKVNDIYSWLQEQKIEIGKAQLYNTYITSFVKAGLITKKKNSMYGLRSSSLYETLRDVERNLEKELSKIKEHARLLEEISKKG
jgi:hypothetical protein